MAAAAWLAAAIVAGCGGGAQQVEQTAVIDQPPPIIDTPPPPPLAAMEGVYKAVSYNPLVPPYFTNSPDVTVVIDDEGRMMAASTMPLPDYYEALSFSGTARTASAGQWTMAGATQRSEAGQPGATQIKTSNVTMTGRFDPGASITYSVPAASSPPWYPASVTATWASPHLSPAYSMATVTGRYYRTATQGTGVPGTDYNIDSVGHIASHRHAHRRGLPGRRRIANDAWLVRIERRPVQPQLVRRAGRRRGGGDDCGAGAADPGGWLSR